MILYPETTREDFVSYWSGCVAFHINAKGNVTVWRIGGTLTRISPSRRGMASGCRVDIRKMGGESKTRNVAVDDLTRSPEWTIHRIRGGYYVHPISGDLCYATWEPHARRMRKGTHHGDFNVLDPLGRKSVRPDPSDDPCLSAYEGIAKVMSVGHTYNAQRVISVATAQKNTRTLLADLFKNEATKCVVPDTCIAFVKAGETVHVMLEREHIGLLEKGKRGKYFIAPTSKEEDEEYGEEYTGLLSRLIGDSFVEEAA